ncbi:MAG: hypothetical protein J6D03_02130 [Clostridia bacterium]|nr:hypothetical protein [Clostridia bacterium]
MSNEDFREKLRKSSSNKHRTDDDIRQELQAQYEYLNNEYSQIFMRNVLYVLGREIEREFPGVRFSLCERTKSETSHKKKQEKVLKKESNKDKKIFDTLGCCLVIEHIPFGTNIEHKLCQKHLTERARKYTEIEENKLKLKKTIQEYKQLEEEEEKEIQEDNKEIQELEEKANASEATRKKVKLKKERLERTKERNRIEKESHQKHISTIEELIQTYQQQYDVEDKEANNALARHILNKIIDMPIIAKKLGITRVPHRSKVHDGGKSGYYIAFHDSLTSTKVKEWRKRIQEKNGQDNINIEKNSEKEQKDSKVDGKDETWVLEIQAMSIQNHEQTKQDGEAQHSKCDGKARILPPLGETSEENEKFRQRVLKDTPKYMVYQSSIIKEDGTMRKGRVYVCSEIENVTYHFLEALEKNPELFKYIIGKENLFSDKSEIVTDDDLEI